MTTPIACVRQLAARLDERPSDLDTLIDQVADRPFVLLGEASHGTAEFYRLRAEITRRLIEDKGFEAVLVEADWPDMLRLSRFVTGDSQDALLDAFDDFQRFPRWMWRNEEVRDFVLSLRDHNASLGAPSGGNRQDAAGVGLYGMDLYSLHRSAEAVIAYLEGVDPEQAERARGGYACLDHRGDPFHYGRNVAFGLSPSCEETSVKLLTGLMGKAAAYLEADGPRAAAEQFFAEQNARVVVNAEAYYRAMFGSRVDTWNLRDAHMTDTLGELHYHLIHQGREG
jgi:erythromycin esterase-like protein